jgi:hypothetical protein
MKLGPQLLAQFEHCGHAATLARDHREVGEDKHGMREIRTEISRAWGVQDQAQLPEADAALRWLMAETHVPGLDTTCEVGVELDLFDGQTGEVLMGGRAGAVIDYGPEVLIVAWTHADAFDVPEPEDDLGLLALGLAAAKGRSFRVATVAVRGGETFPRRSRVFFPEECPAILARIKAAISRPRIACPGEWCNACRQNVYCDAWLARARVALTVFEGEAPLLEGETRIPQLDITDQTAGAIMDRVRKVEKAAELAKEQIKSHVRRGGRCIVNGKEYYLGERAGRETADVAALKAAGLDQYVRRGDPFEMPGWRKPRS